VYAGSETRVIADGPGSPLTAVVLNVSADGAGVNRGDRVTFAWPASATNVIDQP
jgi:hypothetical protein